MKELLAKEIQTKGVAKAAAKVAKAVALAVARVVKVAARVVSFDDARSLIEGGLIIPIREAASGRSIDQHDSLGRILELQPNFKSLSSTGAKQQSQSPGSDAALSEPDAYSPGKTG